MHVTIKYRATQDKVHRSKKTWYFSHRWKSPIRFYSILRYKWSKTERINVVGFTVTYVCIYQPFYKTCIYSWRKSEINDIIGKNQSKNLGHYPTVSIPNFAGDGRVVTIEERPCTVIVVEAQPQSELPQMIPYSYDYVNTCPDRLNLSAYPVWNS